MASSALPLFHLYGDPPDDSAFDFIHIETIRSRSSVHDWTIRAHRHRNLFQVLLIEQGGGEMSFETAIVPFAAPAVILMPATTAHGFRFTPQVTNGWVVSFTEDVADALGDQSGEALARLKELAVQPLVPLKDPGEAKRLSALCAELDEESSLAREGYRLAMRALLALIAIEVVRLAASRARSGAVTLSRADAQVEQLRRLIDEHFRKERLISFYAEKLAMTADRLERPREARDRRHRRPSDPPARVDRSQAPARVYQPADPRDRLRSGLLRPFPLHAFLPQADRHHAAGLPRGPRRLSCPLAVIHTELTTSLVKRLTGKVKAWFALKSAFDAITDEAPPKEVLMRKLSSASVAMILAISLYFMLFWGFEALRMLTSPSYGLDDVWRSQFVFAIGSYFHLTPIGLIKLAAFFGTLKLAVAAICAVHILDRFRSLVSGTADSEILDAGPDSGGGDQHLFGRSGGVVAECRTGARERDPTVAGRPCRRALHARAHLYAQGRAHRDCMPEPVDTDGESRGGADAFMADN